MGTVTLKYRTDWGSWEEQVFDTDIEDINLSGRYIGSIDLGPLADCASLQTLNLRDNELQELDLSPLAKCDSLQRVYLYHNRLQEVDLSPLINSTILLWIETDVEAGVTIFSRDTSQGRLPCPGILYDFPIRILDLRYLKNLFSLVRQYEPHNAWKPMHLTQGLRTALDLDELPLLDISCQQREAIMREEDTEGIRKRVIEVVCAQIDQGGTTIGMDVECAVATHGELAVRMGQVLELRQQELDDITLRRNRNENTVDLRSLWLTAYGHQILSRLRLGLSCSREELNRVKAALRELGFRITLTDSGEPVYPSTKMSDALREYIWFIADYNKIR